MKAPAPFRIEYDPLTHFPTLIVPPWEWSSAEPSIAGHPYWPILPNRGDHPRMTWATFIFTNGGAVSWAWGAGEGAISLWTGLLGAPPGDHRHDATSDDVLRLLLDVAAREAAEIFS